MKRQGKLNIHIILKTMLILLIKNYQNQCVIVETTACQSWRGFFRHSVDTDCSSVSHKTLLLQPVVGLALLNAD